MSDSFKFFCPKCRASNVQLSFEQENKLRLAFECLQCSNRFFADEDLKVKGFNFNVTVEINSEYTSELDLKIIELVQKGNFYKAVKFYQEQKKSSLKEAKTYVDNLTGYQAKKQTTDGVFGFTDNKNFILYSFIIATFICLSVYFFG